MDNWLLKLLNVSLEEGKTYVGHEGPLLHNGMGSGWLLLLGVGLAVLAWVSYRWIPAELPKSRRYILLGLRLVFLFLLLLLMAQPTLKLKLQETKRRAVLVLVDTSASMGINDPRPADSNASKRAALAQGMINPDGGLNQDLDPVKAGEASASRIKLTHAMLSNDQEGARLLARLHSGIAKDGRVTNRYDIIPYHFARDLKALSPAVDNADRKNDANGQPTLPSFPWVKELLKQDATNATVQTRRRRTALGDSLREMITAKAAKPLAGIFLITDGANNFGVPPRELVAELNRRKVPLHIYGVGISRPRDVIVEQIFAPRVAFVDDEINVDVRLTAQGLKSGGEQVSLTLEMAGADTVTRLVKLPADGEKVESIPLSLPKTLSTLTNHVIKATVSPVADETDGGNNTRTTPLKVVNDKIKVLLVEESPRWDYRYLYAMLNRDKRIELKTLLFEGDPNPNPGAITTNSPHVSEFPANKTELYQYHVVIFGDVNPDHLNSVQKENLNRFVSEYGGAFVMIAGKRFSPHAWGANDHSDVGDMLPVEFAPLAGSVSDRAATDPVFVKLTTLGRQSSMLRLARVDPDEKNPAETIDVANMRTWLDLPPIYWMAPDVKPKLSAEVLLEVDSDPQATAEAFALENPNPDRSSASKQHAGMPILAMHQYGLGQVMYLGTDNFWRWRRRVGDRIYTAIWGQIAQRMALQRLATGLKATQLSMDETRYVVGERIQVFARLFTRAGYDAFQTEIDPKTKQYKPVAALYTSADGQTQGVVQMRQVEGRPGLFVGEFTAPAEGDFKFSLRDRSEEHVAFRVEKARYETGDTAMNHKLLAELARETGGTFYHEEDLHKLPANIIAPPKIERSTRPIDLWDKPLFFILLLLVVTIEWVVRKFSYLK
ncbi:MAG: hypothetical protein VX705_03135 [Verrucomicrobiota bacterium]|nr:hypothetical protein [Verrucomicrobiota bacterium]